MSKQVLVIDNYDSFVYVLVQYLGQLQVDPVVYRNDTENLPEIIADTQPDALLISPGPGRPENAGHSTKIVQDFSGEVPILGVCLGHQCVAAAFGGQIVRDTQVSHGKTSDIEHNSKGIFKDIAQPFVATRYHSLLVEQDGLPAELEISAATADGRIMGLSHKTHATYGIQFHPESVLTEAGMPLLRNFLEIMG